MNYSNESNKKAIIAVRAAEGMLRQAQYKSCFTKNGKFTPIWDMTDELIKEAYEKYDIELPEIYDHVTRTGCMGCPYGFRNGSTEKELRLITKPQRKFVTELFEETYAVLGLDAEKIKRECGDYEDKERD